MDETFEIIPAPPHEEIPADRLRWRCSPDAFRFRSTEELVACEQIIGQKRAVDAIRQGLEIKSPGYNIFVAGLTGTGKATTIKQILQEIDRSTATPGDKCFVTNFRDPDRPLYVALPGGQGRVLRQEMAELVEALRRDIPRVFEADAFKGRRQQILQGFAAREQKLVKGLEKDLEAKSFTLVRVEMGPITKPEVAYMHKGKPVRLDDIEEQAPELKAKQRADIRTQHQRFVVLLAEALKKSRDLAREAKRDVEKLQHEFAHQVIDGLIHDIKENHRNQPKLNAYLEDVEQHILDHLALFEEREDDSEPDGDPYRVYQVNVLVDNSETRGAPIIIETSPTYKNLFGSIERVNDGPGVGSPSDFMMIKGGAILAADGGYLVFNLIDALHDSAVWPMLKRTLKNSSLAIQSYDALQLFAGSALKPEPIDLSLKVVVIGDHLLYQMLYAYEEEFPKIFKVKAEFDSMMPRDESVLDTYARFICKIVNEEKLRPFAPSGVASLIEEAVRHTGRSDKITTRFSDVADLIRESSYWAGQKQSPLVTDVEVDEAIAARKERVDLIEDKVREMYVDGTVLIDTQGERVGVVNGLSIFDAGDHVFGQPARITAQAGMGRAGIINIEREAELSGKTHNKGVLILEGYLRSRFAQDKPLSMSASIGFEQSYSQVDGDSASSTEVYALLSSLSGIPIRQHLAVTGSVNQFGEIQPIGGVNEKIEGFYDICAARGLAGNEGVLIPALNVGDLMLRKDIVAAVAAGRFHILPVRTIDEGIEILTGVKAGERNPTEGRYPPGTLYFLVDERLADLAEGLREYGEEPPEDGGDGHGERD